MKNSCIPLILLIGISVNVFAQKESYKELRGDKYYAYYSFDKAIQCYSASKHLSVEGQRRLADSYHKTDLEVQSEQAFLSLIDSGRGIIPEDYYNYAMELKSNGKYEESNKWMDKFKELKPDDLRVKDYSANKNKLPDLLKDAGKYKIEHLNLNTDALDFGTTYFKDKVVFTSTRTAPNVHAKKYVWTDKPFWDMYISEVDGDQLKTPEIFDKSLNGKMHDGPASFSNNGTFIAFTRNNYEEKRKDRVVELQICFSNYKDGKWSKPVPFFLNSKAYSIGQPCLTSDGNTMYFTSDMPGGFGGADIYRIKKEENGEWGKPENLGDKINTEGDEMFPFFEEKNNVLFFSSNGRFGLGGLDIFSCSVIGSGFGPVSNAGSPLNTQYNDYAAIANPDNNKGYFSSDRIGGSGGDDIYSFAFKQPDVRFTVYSPPNIPVERRVRETFPIRNYIFFNIGSTDIPDRYVLLTKDQAKAFSEDKLEEFTPRELSGRSKRQLLVYYNVLNILADRMGKNPSTTITLVGSSEKGPEDGKVMAGTVRKYLSGNFGIDSLRIKIEGRDKPKIPSEHPGGVLELDLLRAGDRRVSIESNSPALLIEFQSSPNSPLRPVEILTVQDAPPDSYVSFKVDGAIAAFSSWSLEIKDETGNIQNFGPYTQEMISIPGKSILGIHPEGKFKATMIGERRNGSIVKEDTTVQMILWSSTQLKEGLRFSVIFEFNESQAINIYEKYLNEIVTPKIPENGKVIIHGHTDIIGEEAHNLELSIARANEVKSIIENSLSKAGRNDVKFEVHGFGEDVNLAPFENKFPEERFYNRTVIIDIIPAN
jgi:outer membrane protein OmpA-like peptidoglycan-associated protein